MKQDIVILTYEKLRQLLGETLLRYGFKPEKADQLASIMAGSTLDGIFSHGINRFPRFIDTVKKGIVDKDAEPVRISGAGAIEQWDGQGGPGILNAWRSMERAMELAGKGGIGCVGLRNTNHWLRGGTYGWQAAEAGYIGICFTNTKPNMVPWGGAAPRIGNNPLIIGIPREAGHVVLDMAMSQYSFGKIETYAMKGEKLPYPGGLSVEGRLTDDPEEIMTTENALPAGYWKGSALSMMLDMLAALIAGGDPVSRIDQREEEYGLSQVFLAISSAHFSGYREQLLEEIVDYTRQVRTIEGQEVHYPGERTLMRRKEQLRDGIRIDRKILEEIKAL